MTRAIVPGATDSNYTYDPLGAAASPRRSRPLPRRCGAAPPGTPSPGPRRRPPPLTYLHAGSSEIAEYDGGGDARQKVRSRTVRRRVHRDGDFWRNEDVCPHQPPGQRHRHGRHQRSPRRRPLHLRRLRKLLHVRRRILHDARGDDRAPSASTGQRYDPETNLYYYKARYYCVGIGRFCETDPVGYGPDVNCVYGVRE